MTVDSGAPDHVMPIGWIAFLATTVSAGSLHRLHCVAANGSRIPNEGQQMRKFMSKEGVIAALTFKMAEVNKPLAPVAKLINDYHRLVFDKTGSFMLSKKDGSIMRLRRERGVFNPDAYVGQDPAKSIAKPEASFHQARVSKPDKTRRAQDERNGRGQCRGKRG